MDPVPLSEDEQRILHEIERSFYENDPEFARGVSTATLNQHTGRNTRLSVFGFAAGLLLLLYSLDQMFWLSAVGFLLIQIIFKIHFRDSLMNNFYFTFNVVDKNFMNHIFY